MNAAAGAPWRALAGRSVVVTRARHQAEAFASALEACGARVLFFPTVTVTPAGDANEIDAHLRDLAGFNWIVVTSANAAREFAVHLRARAMRVPESVRVAAVGPATAGALAAEGVRVHAQPATFAGAAVAAAMGDLRGARVLLPQGDRARPETAAALRERGASVTELTVYRTATRTAPENADMDALQALRDGVDALTFTSPSTVRGFADLCGDEAAGFARRSAVATIGPTTSAAVRAQGWPEPVEAAVATTDGLVAALERHFGSPAARGAPR